MAISSNCCLNPFPSTPNSSSTSVSLPSRTTQVACPKKERSWKSQCILGLTCVIIGQEMGNLEGIGAIAAEEMQLAVESKIKVQRWSDRGRCQPWRQNSLETIVPENLPRPSARRRWETVEFAETAPVLKVTKPVRAVHLNAVVCIPTRLLYYRSTKFPLISQSPPKAKTIKISQVFS
ncbi:uncharacterized protein Fot_13163 [Forsythia ovata]|uniref:Uncharacterized protein n=1 Tax=Forsythia ovata TaxID=205694 RepID=A0ABD1W2N9_9LAMI